MLISILVCKPSNHKQSRLSHFDPTLSACMLHMVALSSTKPAVKQTIADIGSRLVKELGLYLAILSLGASSKPVGFGFAKRSKALFATLNAR